MSPLFGRSGRPDHPDHPDRSDRADRADRSGRPGRPERPDPGPERNRTERPRAEGRVVTLIRKPGCHLCDDAQRVVERVCGELGASWEERDITRDAELHRLYWEQIPVVLVDGAQHDFWRVDPARLRRALLG